ncbi:hypothetical protein INT47_003365 [Mucor saturninus]|uniref:Uncharacterized protein n=1 Tax=Mucor saturninus TaxID=64648 RepID=A0A8H7V7C5_9FUNG|nr:hypothetical protein INT47_003365 [Mucor saturninus]
MSLNDKVLKSDHSFKVACHMGKINGEPTFSALYTSLNEYEEIRRQLIAPSKALTHLLSPFKLFDRNFLEDVLPSLLENVSRSTTSQTDLIFNSEQDVELEDLKIPEMMNMLVHSNVARNHATFNTRPRRTEVAMNEVSLVKICYENQVNLFRTSDFSEADLPRSLKQLLECVRSKKKFSSNNTGPRLTDSVLVDLNCNIISSEFGARNREDIMHKSRYSPWVIQGKNMMRLYLDHNPVKNHTIHHIEKLPVDFMETLGITALDTSFLTRYAMKPSLESQVPEHLSTEMVKQKLLQLSFLPIVNFRSQVPIHTKEEVILYNKLISTRKEELLFNRHSKFPDFDAFTKLWSSFADGVKIYYKKPEHIKLYDNKQIDASVFTNTTLLNENIHNTVKNALIQSSRIINPVTSSKAPTPINHYSSQQRSSRKLLFFDYTTS